MAELKKNIYSNIIRVFTVYEHEVCIELIMPVILCKLRLLMLLNGL